MVELLCQREDTFSVSFSLKDIKENFDFWECPDRGSLIPPCARGSFSGDYTYVMYGKFCPYNPNKIQLVEDTPWPPEFTMERTLYCDILNMFRKIYSRNMFKKEKDKKRQCLKLTIVKNSLEKGEFWSSLEVNDDLFKWEKSMNLGQYMLKAQAAGLFLKGGQITFENGHDQITVIWPGPVEYYPPKWRNRAKGLMNLIKKIY